MNNYLGYFRYAAHTDIGSGTSLTHLRSASEPSERLLRLCSRSPARIRPYGYDRCMHVTVQPTVHTSALRSINVSARPIGGIE
jgi:hypothetical protein